MGYLMYEIGARVRFNRNSFSHALAAIKSLQGSETCGRAGEMHFMWINDSATFLNATALDEALSAWRWPVIDVDQNGRFRSLTVIHAPGCNGWHPLTTDLGVRAKFWQERPFPSLEAPTPFAMYHDSQLGINLSSFA